MALSAAYGAIVGASDCARMAYALARFGGVEYIPRCLVLDVLRGWGVCAAALIPTVVVVVEVHRARASVTSSHFNKTTPAVSAGAAVLACYPIVAVVGCVAPIPVWCAASHASPRDYAREIASFARLDDVLFGSGMSVIHALFVFVVVRLAMRLLVSDRRSVVAKVVASWLVLQGLFFTEVTLRGATDAETNGALGEPHED